MKISLVTQLRAEAYVISVTVCTQLVLTKLEAGHVRRQIANIRDNTARHMNRNYLLFMVPEAELS
jgi:hypothetical protein